MSYIVLGIQEREEETICLIVNNVICEEQRFGRIIVGYCCLDLSSDCMCSILKLH